jgi:mannose-6-phosphate isomerase-like protein (cupin superfamily)
MTKLKYVALSLILLVIGQGREFASPFVVTPLNGGQDAPTSPVLFWKGSEAFGKSPLLLDRMAASSYQVYAVHRDRPGTVEHHALDTDIVMVLEGAATFVTGGSITDPRTLRPNEASGSGITDGEAHQLGKGDVAIVPNGTPHWFRDVSPAISYFAVKLRQPNLQTQTPSRVMYWKGSEIFGKGGTVFESQAGTFSRVYALRPSKPLGVELHGVDTDIVLVVDGTGTFVTEGTITEPRSLRPNEGTGASVRDGSPRQLEKGAVLVIPKGTPHWLRDINGNLDFFAVKVR